MKSPPLLKLKSSLLSISLMFASLSNAQESTPAQKDNVLKAGNTWHYDITLTVPEGTNFKPEFKSKPESTENGTVYRLKEMQQCLAKKKIEDIEMEAYPVNIFINDVLRKRQILNVTDGAFLYYGTYKIDANAPTKKEGFITKAPIILYTHKAKAAEMWQWKHEKFSFQFRMISKENEVTVKAGTFKADKIRMDLVAGSNEKVQSSKEIWFAPGVGVIKEVEKQYLPNGKAIVKTLELTKHGVEAIRK